MSLIESPPKPVNVNMEQLTWAPKKQKRTSRIMEPHNAKKVSAHYHLSPVKPIIEETDIEDLLGAEDDKQTDRVLIDCIQAVDGRQVFLFDDGTYALV